MSYCELPQNRLGLLSQGTKKANLVWFFHHFKNLFSNEFAFTRWAGGEGDGQGSLASCSPWGCKESDMTERLDSLGQCTHECQQFWCCSLQGINHASRGKSYLFLFIC